MAVLYEDRVQSPSSQPLCYASSSTVAFGKMTQHLNWPKCLTLDHKVFLYPQCKFFLSILEAMEGLEVIVLCSKEGGREEGTELRLFVKEL